MISLTIIRAHKQEGHSTTFMCPISKLKFVLAAVLSVDYCNLLHTDIVNDKSILQTYGKMQASVKVGVG